MLANNSPFCGIELGLSSSVELQVEKYAGQLKFAISKFKEKLFPKCIFVV